MKDGRSRALKMVVRRDKESVRKWARKEGRKILWQDEKGLWHAAVDLRSTPRFATAVEDV